MEIWFFFFFLNGEVEGHKNHDGQSKMTQTHNVKPHLSQAIDVQFAEKLCVLSYIAAAVL